MVMLKKAVRSSSIAAHQNGESVVVGLVARLQRAHQFSGLARCVIGRPCSGLIVYDQQSRSMTALSASLCHH